MKKIKVVQIGLGHDHACMAFDSMLRMSEHFEVAAFAVPESEQELCRERIQRYAQDRKVPYVTVEEALSIPGVEGAVIETEEVNLTKYALMAVRRGLHIHMDKPGGINPEEFSELIRELQERKLVFSTGYMYRFNPYVQQAIAAVESGELGDIYCVEAHMDCEHPREKRQWLAQFPGGMMFFLGCHLVDLIYRIQGKPLEVIPYNMSTGYEGVTGEDFGMTLFRYPNGMSFAKTCAAEPGGFMRRQLVICGTKGTLEIKPLEAYIKDGGVKDMYADMRRAEQGLPWPEPGEISRCEPYNRYDGMMENFAQLVRGEKENPYTYEYELELYQLVLQSCGAEVTD